MSTCNIKIYRTQLTPSRNALVDNLEGYLNNLFPVYSDPSFQYQQLGLDLTIKINVPQGKISESGIGNYVRIEQDDRIWYYFILGAQWKGTKTVQLTLSIDSINTFRNDLHWTEKTTIVRQHGDRFVQQIDNSFIRRIDPEGEGIATEKYRASVSNIREEIPEVASLEWYLMYRTRDVLTPENIADPVGCYLLANQPLQIQESVEASVTLTKENLTAGKFYYFNYLDNPGGQIQIGEGQTFTLGSIYKLKTSYDSATWLDRVLQGVVLYKDGEGLHYGFEWNDVVYTYTALNPADSQIHSFTTPIVGPTSNSDIQYLSARVISRDNNTSYNTINSLTIHIGSKWRMSNVFFPIAEQALQSNEFFYTAAGQPYKIVNDIYSVDRTDSRIMKILALPYAPCNVTHDSATGNYVFPEEWKFEGGELRLTNLNTEFINVVGNIKLPQFNTNISVSSGDALIPQRYHNELPLDRRNDLRESKLYHSDFYTYKAVYDSFAKEIQLEKIKPILTNETYHPTYTAIPVIYKHTNTINSKSLFQLNYNYLANDLRFARYEQIEDYGEYLLIARNNELPIYNNDYLNYIRTGYNYDLKAQELSKQQAAIDIAVNAAATVASFYTGGASAIMLSATSKAIEKSSEENTQDNSPYLAQAGLSMATSTAKTAFNTFFSQAQATNAREAKLSTLAAQSTAVAGADDLDLMQFYNGNQLQLMTYATKDYQKDAIADLFHYCGYTYPHMDYPDITSRLWFNYIQCSPDFREEPNTPFQQYLDDIKARYAAGVTVYHCNNYMWDWDQEYENWEVLLYPEQSYISNDSIAGMKVLDLNDGRYQISFTYLGKQYLNGSASGDDNFVEIELINMYDEVIFTRNIAVNTGEYRSTTTGDFYEAPTQLRYRITYLDKATEWQTISLAGG